MNDLVQKKISCIIKENDVVLFMKGTRESPLCGFSSFVVNALNNLEIDFYVVDVLKSLEMRQGIKEFSQWPTIPQLYIKGEFIGGSDIVSDLIRSGEFRKILEKTGVAKK